jgi:hypothetical protein
MRDERDPVKWDYARRKIRLDSTTSHILLSATKAGLGSSTSSASRRRKKTTSVLVDAHLPSDEECTG